MKDGYIYTVAFTFIISAFFTGLLAIANAAYLPVIQRNQELALKRAVVYVIDTDVQVVAQVEDVFASYIEKKTVSDRDIYVKLDVNRGIESYAVSLEGPGVWGTIRGYIGISADLTELLGIEFTEQHETPGLGGRIDELAFKEQFRGIRLIPGERIRYQEGLDAVTGATGSSNAVIRIVNNTLDDVLPKLEVSP